MKRYLQSKKGIVVIIPIVAALVVSVSAFWAGCRWLEWRNLYSLADRTMKGNPSDEGIAYEDVWLNTEDKVHLHGWWVPASGQHPEEKPTILFCHGSGGNISYWLQKLGVIKGLEVNQFLFDYRGYGLSLGKPTERGTYADVDSAYDYLIQERKIPVGKLIVYGESLGGAIAIDLVSRKPEAALITDGTFTSTLAMARVLFPKLPGRWMLRYRYDSLSKVSRIHVPVLVLHNPDDPVIPYFMAKQLFNSFPNAKALSPFTGTHVDHFDNEKDYLKAVSDFIGEYVDVSGCRPAAS